MKETVSCKGVELTEEETKLISSLKRLAKKWDKHGKRLALFGKNNCLSVLVDYKDDFDEVCYIKGIKAFGDNEM